MKKLMLFVVIALAFFITGSVYAGQKWSNYDELAVGNVADDDDFMLRDVSDTTMAGTGTELRLTWASLKSDIKDALVVKYNTIYIDAGAMIPCTTNGAEPLTNEYPNNDIDIDYFAFDSGATEERVQFKFRMSESWDLGTIKVKFDWTSDTSSSMFDTVEWGIKFKSISNNDLIDIALGTPQVISDAVLAVNGTKLQISNPTPSITVGGTSAFGHLIIGEIYRNTDGSDTMVEDAWLFGITIQYQEAYSITAW